jgi:hypothetical protein
LWIANRSAAPSAEIEPWMAQCPLVKLFDEGIKQAALS